MYKRNILIILILCVLVLAGCSKEEKKKKVILKYDEVTRATLGPNEGKDPKKTIGFDGEMISLGVITPQSGDSGYLGNVIKIGNQTYWDARNYSGGVDGRYKVKLISKDSANESSYDKELSISAYDELSKEVVAFQQIMGDDVILALKNKQLKNKQLIVPTSFSNSWVRNPLVLPVANTYTTQAINGVGYYLSKKDTNIIRVCSLTLNDSYGNDADSGIDYVVKKYDVNYPSKQKFNSGENITSKVEKLVAEKCDSVLFTGSFHDINSVLKVFASKASKIDIIGLSPSWIPEVDLTLDQATRQYALEHFYVVSSGASWGDTNVPGMKKMMQDIGIFKPNQTSNQNFILGYVQAWAMDQVLEKAVANGDLSPEGVTKALSNVDTLSFEGLYPAYEFGPNSKSRVVPEPNSIYMYTTTKPSYLMPAGENSINYADKYSSEYKYGK